MLKTLKNLFSGSAPEEIEYDCNTCHETFLLPEGDELRCTHCGSTSVRTTDPKRVQTK